MPNIVDNDWPMIIVGLGTGLVDEGRSFRGQRSQGEGRCTEQSNAAPSCRSTTRRSAAGRPGVARYCAAPWDYAPATVPPDQGQWANSAPLSAEAARRLREAF